MRPKRLPAVLSAAAAMLCLLVADGVEAAPPEAGPEAAGGPLPRIELVGDEFKVSTGATSLSRMPDVAYNSTANEYLVVWDDNRNPEPASTDVFGQRVTAAGALAGVNFPVIEYEEYQGAPSVAYNSTDNRYLVAWQSQVIGGPNGTYGQRVSSSGGLLGGGFSITSAGYEISTAYSVAANEWLVTARGNGIRGQRVGSDGSLAGPEIDIATAGAHAPNGQVAYNPNANEYLATWRDQTAENLQGQRISASGALLGGPRVLSSIFPGPRRAAGVAFDPGNDRYLAVFREFSEFDLMGQFVISSGATLGSAFTIASGLEQPATPYIAYSPINRVFVIVAQEGGDIEAWVLSEHGTVMGPPLTIARGTAVTRSGIAYNSRTGEFLVVWADERNEALGEMDIYAQVLDIVGVSAGDANCDGSVDAIDAALALQANAGLIGWAPCLAAADVNGDGSLNAIDAALILQYVAGLIGTLPP